MTDLEQSALAVYFANCQGIKSDPLPMIRKILALGEGDRRDAARNLREVIGNEYMDETARRRLLVAADMIDAALRGEGEK